MERKNLKGSNGDITCDRSQNDPKIYSSILGGENQSKNLEIGCNKSQFDLEGSNGDIGCDKSQNDSKIYSSKLGEENQFKNLDPICDKSQNDSKIYSSILAKDNQYKNLVKSDSNGGLSNAGLISVNCIGKGSLSVI